MTTNCPLAERNESKLVVCPITQVFCIYDGIKTYCDDYKLIRHQYRMFKKIHEHERLSELETIGESDE